jgi:hypothetical protein
MVKLSIEETSGVDHPAHMQEGWIVMKSTGDEIREVFDSLTENTEEVVKEDMVPKADLDEALAKIADYEQRMAKMEDEMKSYKKAEEVEEVDEAAEILKSAPEAVIKMLNDAQAAAEAAEARAEAAEAVVKAERDAQALVETVEFVKSWDNLPIDADEFAPALIALRGLDETVAKQVEDVLTAANQRAENADLFTEIGKSATPVDGGTAYARLTSLAKARVEQGQAETFEQAFADAASENTDIYNDYLTEKGA